MQNLTVDNRQSNAELRRVVGRHDSDVAVWHWETELVNGDDDVRDDEADGAHAAAQLRPRPEVIEELDARDRTPHHGEDK